MSRPRPTNQRRCGRRLGAARLRFLSRMSLRFPPHQPHQSRHPPRPSPNHRRWTLTRSSRDWQAVTPPWPALLPGATPIVRRARRSSQRTRGHTCRSGWPGAAEGSFRWTARSRMRPVMSRRQNRPRSQQRTRTRSSRCWRASTPPPKPRRGSGPTAPRRRPLRLPPTRRPACKLPQMLLSRVPRLRPAPTTSPGHRTHRVRTRLLAGRREAIGGTPSRSLCRGAPSCCRFDPAKPTRQPRALGASRRRAHARSANGRRASPSPPTGRRASFAVMRPPSAYSRSSSPRARCRRHSRTAGTSPSRDADSGAGPAAAQHIVLRASDFPTGWTFSPAALSSGSYGIGSVLVIPSLVRVWVTAHPACAKTLYTLSGRCGR